jgi:hypothetical protein
MPVASLHLRCHAGDSLLHEGYLGQLWSRARGMEVATCESVMSSLGETWQSNWPLLHISVPFVTKGEKQLSIKTLTIQIAYNSRIIYFHLLAMTLRITKVHPVD